MKKAKRTFILIALIYPLLLPFTSYTQEQSSATTPNVLFIIIDDLGWKDVGFNGGSFIKTPNVDKLSQQGIIFTNSYAGAANCAPSRANLLTGLNTPRHKIYTVANSDRGDSRNREIIPVANTETLDDGFFTMAEMFKVAGYTTAAFGKWHLSEDPTSHGFDTNLAGEHIGAPNSKTGNGYFSPYGLQNMKDGPEGEHLTDRLTQEAIKFIKSNRNTPFFAYLSYYAVHTPIQPKNEFKRKYDDRHRENLRGINTGYAAMVENTDANIGQLMETLDTLNLTEETIVVFTSDNGGIASLSSQLPLRSGKGSYYEGGIRVPTIIRWPGQVQPKTVTNQPITHLDFYPTFKEILNIDFEKVLFDGTSILPILNGNDLEQRPLYWHFPIYLESFAGRKDDARDLLFRTRPGAIIRYGDWKLHQYFEDGDLELYNLQTDIGERNNLAQSHPDKVKELLLLLTQWQRRINAPIPTKRNPEYHE